MPTLFILVIIVLAISGILSPIAKGIGRRLARGGPENADLQRMAVELERAEQRLAETERRLSLAEERLDFQEKLLSARSSAPRDPLR